MPDEPPTIAYLFTTFPKSTETFLQREIIALQALGVRLRIYSFWGGGGTFRGIPVTPFPKWKLLTLIWMIPYEGNRRREVLRHRDTHSLRRLRCRLRRIAGLIDSNGCVRFDPPLALSPTRVDW